MPSRPARSSRGTSWSSRSPTRRPARCASGSSPWADPGSWRRRSTLPPSASSATSGRESTGGELPGILESKVALIVDLARTLPGGYRYVAARDLAGEVEWAKARRIPPAAYEEAVDREGHDGPLPARLFAPLYRGYERAKARVGRIDFEDMLEMTVRLLEDEPTVAAEVRDRYRWFSVDEYQDTNTLQQAAPRHLARRPAGPGRRRRRGPDDLHLHRRLVRVADRVRRAVPGGQGHPSRDELPEHAGGPRAGEPAPGAGTTGGGRTAEAARADPPERTGPDDPPVRDEPRRGAGRGRRGAPAHRRGDRGRGGGRPRADERPARGLRSRLPGGGGPVPAPRRALLRPPRDPPGAPGRADRAAAPEAG